MNCNICHQLSETTSHEACRNCIYCGSEVMKPRLDKLLKEDEGQTDYKIVIHHEICRRQQLERDFKAKPVVITQEHLDMLNRSHLFMDQVFYSSQDLSIETNQEKCEIMVSHWFNEMDLEEKFRALKNLEAITARMSIALSKDKNAIQTKIQAKEIEKYKEVKEYREGQLTRKTEKQMKSLSEIEAANEKANPQLKARRKAIESFIKVGLSKADATRMVDEANKPN
jgi:hypothetical protein